MQNFASKLLIVFFVLVLSQSGNAFLHTQGHQIVNANGIPVMLRGYGLGGWLVPEGYMLHIPGFGSPTSIRTMIENLIGPQNTQQFYAEYEANYVNAADVEQIAQWGFNSIRLPFHYNVFYDTASGTFRQEGFALLDTLLNWCDQNNLYLILDMHCAPGGQNKDNISDSDGIEARLWTEPSIYQPITIKIWKEIATRYVNHPRVGGYDLLNEPVLPQGYNNQVLRDFYIQLTDTIRQVDSNHIIFIEGNWYATDFNLLTPPWDNNMVYSFHKYWNETTVNTIQYLLDIRNQHDIPLWLGETGENSNPWFYETVQLMEQHNIGWCWWAHKKLATITSPLSAIIPADYQTILNYWNGQGSQPPVSFATSALLQMAEALKIENCEYRSGVIRALLNNDFGTQTRPFRNLNVPGVINAVYYDYGSNGLGYVDADYKNTAGPGGATWNNGWQYRNDGVDIERSQDSQGYDYNIGWTEPGEKLVYTVNIQDNGYYSMFARVASLSGGGKFFLLQDDQPVTGVIDVASSGGWQNWFTVAADSIQLSAGPHQLTFFIIQGGFNLNRMTFFLTATGINDESSESPLKYRLEQNYPNPFNPETTFRYSLAKPGEVCLDIYNAIGEKLETVVNKQLVAGDHEDHWDASHLASGVYYYRLQADKFVDTKKLILLK
ncbi:MAG: cellulase family glycosylhydrolase [Gammaproteobacteria bacterium]|nr:cellulase family glycosylhydrolase [Gammaproteobacteria bacterium]NIW45003.1 cellulase family glycosylhydrolase [Gammaproteobacteria bacterium]NIX59118.1 cellulase family glycosylhydrolase [candidate division Zixibacteria bacterium]